MSDSLTPAIVVLGYERPEALGRLLASLDAAVYPDEQPVPLVISLDRSGSAAGQRTLEAAQAFEWRFGPKRVVQQPRHLGVVGHFRAAGALTVEFGSVILLEDDLTVAPAFYDYASQVLQAYAPDARIAGFSLYGLWFNGFTREPFLPLEDGSDVFFLGVPYTQGLCFSAAQWAAFEAWLAHNSVEPHPDLHPAFLSFGADEWFPALAAYMAQSSRFFCFPRVSLTVGWGDAGAHFAEESSWFQTPVLLRTRGFRLTPLDEALSVYDGFFELLPDRLRALGAALPETAFGVDINATKQPANIHCELVLTTRPARDALMRFGLKLYPPELNIASGVKGSEVSLARRQDVRWDGWSQTEARRRLHAYYWRRYRPSRARSLRFAVARAVEALRPLLRR